MQENSRPQARLIDSPGPEFPIRKALVYSVPSRDITVTRQGMSLKEAVMYRNGLSPSPAILLYRSYIETPFFCPDGVNWSSLPSKSHTGLYGTPLHVGDVWRTIAGPAIANVVRQIGIESHIEPCRYVVRHDGCDSSPGAFFLCIRLHTSREAVDRTTFAALADKACELSPAITDLLEAYGIADPVIEWVEDPLRVASVTPFDNALTVAGSPPLASASTAELESFEFETGPTENFAPSLSSLVPPGTRLGDFSRRPLHPISTALGLDITGPLGQNASLGFYFHEGERVLAVTCSHAITPDHKVSHDRFKAGSDISFVTLVTDQATAEGQGVWRRIVHGIESIGSQVVDLLRLQNRIVGKAQRRVERLGQLIEICANPEMLPGLLSELESEKAELSEALLMRTTYAKRSEVVARATEMVNSSWSTARGRRLGVVDWAPLVDAVSVDGHNYTRDLGVFVADPLVFRQNFVGNVIDIAAYDREYDATFLTKLFGDNFRHPEDGLISMNAVADQRHIRGMLDDKTALVLKDGRSTGLTIGVLSTLEVIHCRPSPSAHAYELGITNYKLDPIENPVGSMLLCPRNFFLPGDSGAMVFDCQGRMVGLAHRQPESAEITYATPAWAVIALIRQEYPDAIFFKKSRS